MFSQTASFEQKTGVENPLNGFTVSLDFNPVAVDIDNDGDLDIFSGCYCGNFSFFRNDGTATNPVFSEQTTSSTNNPLFGFSGGTRSRMEFVDIDNDGDLDLFNGKNTGYILFWKNTGTASVPVFSGTTSTDYFGKSFGAHTNIEFVDIDNDGDKDAFITNLNSEIFYYENTGTTAIPVFTERTVVLNPLVAASGYSYLYGDFADIDNDGDMDYFTGNYQGTVLYYKNTGTASSPIFELQSQSNNMLGSINLGDNGRTDVCIADINGDGVLDAFVGRRAGATVDFYLGKKATTLKVDSISNLDLVIYLNSIENILNIIGETSGFSMSIYDELGKVVHFGNVSNKLDISKFSNGVYFVKITNGEKVQTYKIIKN